MQTVFFKLSNILPFEESVKYLKESVYETYNKKGKEIVESNYKAIDSAIDGLIHIKYNSEEWLNSESSKQPSINDNFTSIPDFIKDVVLPIARLQGDNLPVSKFIAGGQLPPGITQYEKRGLSTVVPLWNPTKCTQCNQCSLMCPHAVIRPFLLTDEECILLYIYFVIFYFI